MQTAGEWACENRYMPGDITSRPGPYNLDAFPFCREPLEWMSPCNPTENVVLVWGSQTGKTTMLENVIGQRIHQAPCPMMMMRPTLDSAEEWSKIRFQALVNSSPVLKQLVVEGRHGNRASSIILQKIFPGGSLDIEGANSPSGVASKSICILIIDEEDRNPESAGEEGDPSTLAEMRTTGFFGRRKIIRTSTPTVMGSSRIWRKFLLTDQNYYHVPCPRCGEYQRLYWTHPETKEYCVTWPKGEPWKAVYRCPYCGKEWVNAEKNEILPVGRWVPKTTGRPYWKGAQLSTLYAPVGWDDFGKLAQEWEDGHPDGQVDKDKLVVFINTRLGECWEDRMDTALDTNELLRRCEPMPTIPTKASMLIGSVDVQGNRLELELCGWGLGLENFGIRHQVFWGKTDEETVWNDLHRFIHAQKWMNADGQRLAVVAVGIDTGFNTDMVYSFIQSHLGWGYFPVKGEAGLGKLIVDSQPHKSHAKFGGLPFVMVGSDGAKARVYSMLRIQSPGPGYCHFAADAGYDESAFKQMTIERRIKQYDKSGQARLVWTKNKHDANEMLDLRQYNLAMATLHAQRYDLSQPILWQPLGTDTDEVQPSLTEKQTAVSTKRDAEYRFDRSAFFRR